MFEDDWDDDELEDWNDDWAEWVNGDDDEDDTMMLVARNADGELVDEESFTVGQLIGGVERVLQSWPKHPISFWVTRGMIGPIHIEFGMFFDINVSETPGFPHLVRVGLRPKSVFTVDTPDGVVPQLDLLAMAYGFGTEQTSLGDDTGWSELSFERLSDVPDSLEEHYG